MDEDEKDFLESFGITSDPATTPPPTDPVTGGGDPAPAAAPVVTDPAVPSTTPTDPPAVDPTTGEPLPVLDESVFDTSNLPDDTNPNADPNADTNPAPRQPDRASQAFAQMRIENTAYKNTLQNVAAILGIEATGDPLALTEAIKTKALEAQAKKDNVPVEILQKLDRLESLESKFTQSQLEQHTAMGLEQLKNQFKLDDDSIVGFVQTLLADGINPYEQQVDFVNQYRVRNFDTLLQKAQEQGRAEEAARAAKANQHGSTPGTEVGGTPGAQDKITTVKGLDDFFSKVK